MKENESLLEGPHRVYKPTNHNPAIIQYRSRLASLSEIDVEQVKIANYADTVKQLDAYYGQVKRQLLKYQSCTSGLFPQMSSETEVAAVRDSIYCAVAIWSLYQAYKRIDDDRGKAYELGQSTVKCMRGILFCWMRQAEEKLEKYKTNQCTEHALHSKFHLETGLPLENDIEYGHLQLDVVSLYLLFLVQMIMSGLQIIYTMDEVNFVQNLVYYVERAYRTPDFGMWERGSKYNDNTPEIHASSIGMAKSALEAINGCNLFGDKGASWSVVYVDIDAHSRNRSIFETLLPRESSSKTAISYVTRVRLGGKGYAPPENCLLLPHLKCLELFVDILNHLQTIMEEDLSPKSSIKKLINTLKKKLLKCDSNKLKQGAIEKVTEKLHFLTSKVLDFSKSQQCFSNTPQICQETLNVLHYLVNYVNCTCSTFNPEKILQQRLCKRTPINLPPLLGYFRSPEEESVCEEISIINEDSNVSNSSSLGYPPPFMSYFHNSDNSCSAASAACTTPTKTNFMDCIVRRESIEENVVFNELKCKRDPIDNGKRPILSDIANIDRKPIKRTKLAADAGQPFKIKEACNKKSSKKIVKKTNLTKKFKLIEGQGKITSFFSTFKK